MTSRDERASYYDLELPDGTRTEAWSVLRAALSPEEALGYVKACILTRIMRDGRKDVDRLREAEKVGIEAGMLREAMAAHLATPDPVTAALDAVDSHDPRECAVRIGDLEHKLAAQQMSYESQQIDHLDRIAELERELREARQVAHDYDRICSLLRKEVRTLSAAVSSECADCTKTTELERERDEARARVAELERALNALRQTLDTERRAAVATAEELERVRKELADLRDRYRPRRQSEEPAPAGVPVLSWNHADKKCGLGVWFWRMGENVAPDGIWTHQPPAPEAEREGEVKE